MKQTIAFTIAFACVLLTQAQSVPGIADYRAMFWEQVAATCAAPVRWEKSVEELGEDAEYEKESHVYTVDCEQGVAFENEDSDRLPLNFSEFEVLFEFDFENVYLAEFVNTQRDGNSIQVKLKAGEEDGTPLRKQVFEVDPGSGKLRFAEVEVVKNNWLYDFTIHTQVWFDAEGRYARHETETVTTVALSGKVHTRILGRRLS